MTEPIIFTLPMPPSANRYWRRGANGTTYVSDEAQEYKDAVYYQLIRQRPVDGDMKITMRIYRARKSGDLDNRIKIVLDALNGIIYHDDKQIVEIHAYRHDDAKRPRVEVEIT